MITSTVGHVMDWSFLSVFFNHQRPRTFRTRREGNHVEVLKWQLNESSDGCGSKMMGIPPQKNNRILEKSWKNGEIKRSNMKLYDFCWGDVWFFASHGPWPDVCLKSGIIHSVAAVVWCHHSWNFWTSAWGDFDPVSLWMTCFDNLTSKKWFTYRVQKKRRSTSQFVKFPGSTAAIKIPHLHELLQDGATFAATKNGSRQIANILSAGKDCFRWGVSGMVGEELSHQFMVGWC